MLQQTIYSRKETGQDRTLYLLARITLTLISSLAFIGCFRKVNFQGINIVT